MFTDYFTGSKKANFVIKIEMRHLYVIMLLTNLPNLVNLVRYLNGVLQIEEITYFCTNKKMGFTCVATMYIFTKSTSPEA